MKLKWGGMTTWKGKAGGILVLGILIVVVGAAGMWMGDFFSKPFLVNRNLSMGVTDLKIFSFEPIVLWNYEKDGGMFTRVLYRDNQGGIKLTNLWLSGTFQGRKLDPAYYYDGVKEVTTLNSLKDVGKFLKFGKRIRAEFITGQTLRGGEVDPNNAVCQESPRICQVYAYAKAKSFVYTNFSVTGYLPENEVVPVLALWATGGK